MTFPPESRRPEAHLHFEPYPVPQATAMLAPVPSALAPQPGDPGPPGWPPPPAPYPASYPAAASAPVMPGDVEYAVDLAIPRDPRVAAFGAGPVTADPPVVRTLARWIIPVVTAIVGVLLGIALSGGSDRPSAPMPISAPGVTETVTATQTAVAPSSPAVRAKTVTRRVTTTAVKVTTAPPPAPSTVTETVRETVRVTVQRRVAVGGRQPVPILP